MRKFLVIAVVGALAITGCSATNNAVNSTAATPTTIYVDAAGSCAGQTPCVTNLPEAVKAATSGDTISVFDGSYTLSSSDAATPAVIIDKPLTITSYDSVNADDNCPEVASDCPQFNVAGAINTPIVIAANDVDINNLAITQKDVPGSNPASAIIYVPASSGGTLISGTLLAELAVIGGRRGVWYLGSDGLISTSRFTNQARDSIFVPATTSSLNVFANTFSGGAGKAVLFENQVGSPASSGNVKLSYNALYGKGNFAVWNSWAEGAASNSVAFAVDHNTIVGTSGAATAILPNGPKPGFSMFSSITYSNNIIQGAGGDAFYVDYTYSPNPSAAPANGQIVVTNTDTFNNKPSEGTNDPSGNYGFSNGAPAGTTIAMYNLNGKNLSNTDPLLQDPANLDFSLKSNSPAIGAGANGTNIGQWQGTRPTVRRVQPACSAAGKNVVVVASNVKGKPTVKFGAADATVVSVKSVKKARITVTVPTGSAGAYVDVAVTGSNGTGILPRGFHYPSAGGGC